MDEKIDNKTKEALTEALEDMIAHEKRSIERREKELWKKVDIPCDLYDAIIALKKADMDAIRKNYDFKNISSLKKAELAAELTSLIPKRFKKIIYALDQGRYDLTKIIVDNMGVIPDAGIPLEIAETFMQYSIIFTGLYDDQKVLFMPNELIDIFVEIDHSDLNRIIKRNTEWINLAHGLLHYYGVMTPWTLMERISRLTRQDIEFFEFEDVIVFACDFYEQIRYTSYGFEDARVYDTKQIIEEHKMRPNVDYYPFTKRQLLEAGEPGYVDMTPQMNSFINFLTKHSNLSVWETNEIAFEIVAMINIGSKPSELIEHLQSWLEFPSFDFLKQLTEKLMELYNNTRQWAIKGYTPDELFREEKKYLKPLPPEPFQYNQQDATVIDFKTRKKVGRNDPCPCGSGKKFKKCCAGDRGTR